MDLSEGVVRVRYQLQRLNGRVRLVEPKTARSRRTLVLPASVRRKLRDHRELQDRERELAGDRWDETGLVFTTPIGTAPTART